MGDSPSELLELIFSYSDLQSISRCRRACRQFLALIDNSPVLQYKIQLYVANQQDCDPDNRSWSISARLDKLRDHQAALRTFKWTKSLPIGYFDTWDFAGDVCGYKKGTEFTFKRIPSIYRNVDEKSWSFSTDFPAQEMRMDPSQDLLVVREGTSNHSHGKVHFLSLATGMPHPNASSPTFNIESKSIIFISLCGSSAGFLVMTPNDSRELHILNWKTGKHSSTGVAANSTFLNQDLLLIWPHDSNGSLSKPLQVYDLDFRLVATFEFPEGLEPDTVHFLNESRRSSPETVPFSTRDGLIAIRIIRKGPVLTMFVTASALPDLISGHRTPIVFPWSMWGRNTCLIDKSTGWPSIHGMRIVSWAGGSKVIIRDFNQYDFRRDIALGLSDSQTTYVGPTAESKLCYRETTVSLPIPDPVRNIYELAVYEDGIILMSRDEGGSLRLWF